MDDLRKKYALNGLLNEIHEKTIESKEKFLKEIAASKDIREQRQKNFDEYYAAAIISPMNGYDQKYKKNKKDSSKKIPLVTKEKVRNSYSSLNEYIEEQVQNKINENKIKKDLEIKNNALFKNENQQDNIQVQQSNIENLTSPTEIRIQSYLNRYQSIYDRAHKFQEQQNSKKNTINEKDKK